MKCSLVCCVGVLLSAVAPAWTGAQYIYLDANGDGVHTAADALEPNKTSLVAIYLDTTHDRDGTAQECNSHTKAPGSAPLEIFSYDLLLRVAEGTGTVEWGPYVDQTGFEPLGKDESSQTDFKTSYMAAMSPVAQRTETLRGSLKLGYISITPKSGDPIILVSPVSSLDPSYFTGFGTMCPGSQFRNTYVLGTDWNDTDGIASATKVDRPAGSLAITGLRLAPSPSRNGVTVSFSSPILTSAKLAIFDVAGRRVYGLPETKVQGASVLRWDGRNSLGGSVASGVYFARLIVGSEVRLERFVIAR